MPPIALFFKEKSQGGMTPNDLTYVDICIQGLSFKGVVFGFL